MLSTKSNLLSVKNFLNNKKALPIALAFMVVALIAPLSAHAFMDTIGQFFAGAIYEVIILPLVALLKVELWILPIIAQYNNFLTEPGVTKGWVALRDLGNMFFIVVLLIIAFSTILKIQTYGYRQLLKRFIIVAILVNFSKTIVGLLIDFSQVIMLTFVDAIKAVAAGNIMVALGLGNIMQGTIRGGEEEPGLTLLIAFVLGAIMMLIAGYKRKNGLAQ